MLIEFSKADIFGECGPVYVNPAFVAAVNPQQKLAVYDPKDKGKMVMTKIRDDLCSEIHLCSGDRFLVLDPEDTVAHCIAAGMNEDEDGEKDEEFSPEAAHAEQG